MMMSSGPVRDRAILGLITLLCWGAVGVALISQHRFDMQPCPWCIVQRMLFVLIGAAALVAAVWPRGRQPKSSSIAAFVVGALATLGAASALWQQVYAAKSSSCARTVADIIVGYTRLDEWLPEIFQARASCADSSSMLGIPYALWSLGLFLVVAVIAIKLHLDQRHRLVIRDIT